MVVTYVLSFKGQHNKLKCVTHLPQAPPAAQALQGQLELWFHHCSIDESHPSASGAHQSWLHISLFHPQSTDFLSTINGIHLPGCEK